MYKAGASSMWASCCGLLNEVMGTGTVRGQQPGFGAGTGPFRFAPSAGYSTYPPTSSGSAGQLCKACGLAFSVFRRKHICSDCKKSFCALCSVLQESLRCCTTCHLLRGTAFQRPQLMALRVKDLRQYLLLRNIPTDTCREKEDLVDLVLCHQEAGENTLTQGGVEEEEEEEEDADTDSQHSLPHSLHASPPSAAHRSASEQSSLSTSEQSALSTSEQSALSASQGDSPLSRSDSSGTVQNQEHGETPTIPLLHLEPASDPIIEVSPVTQRRIRASLSDLDNEGDIESLSVRQLKEILARNFVNYSGCCEKWELIERVHRLYREDEQNRKSMENVSNINSMSAVVSYPPPICNGAVEDSVKAQLASDDHLCRICMDAVIDCVLLECGHMVTCTKCGMRMSECPICRQYVVRAVHVFKS
ncbi:E3 ubiquitin-protein ligase RNF34 isoform X1 [Salmo salar]|uniref:RING-type E3 ubiquitin transferase n=1 Tax=Salmo salar TaxID=8030 RepID=A0A1S3LSD4_SALSA|nr:E3 ubiquitin-protein ligase RNF34-like isoform X1 [Salmo salar]